LFPRSRQQEFEIEGLAGNVWEWCLNKYEKPDDIALDDSGAWRVWRGGSWANIQDNARADNRNNNHPNNRNDNIGFRVVCASHIHLLPSGYRHVPSITVGGMRRRVVGWRGNVPSARCERRRAHNEARRLSRIGWYTMPCVI
jgi:hypothetical protein